MGYENVTSALVVIIWLVLRSTATVSVSTNAHPSIFDVILRNFSALRIVKKRAENYIGKLFVNLRISELQKANPTWNC